MKLEIGDYYTIVYLMGWIVVGIGVYLAMKAGLAPTYNNDTSTGLSVIFGGLYMTAFVRNSQLKLQLALLEREVKGD